MRPSLNSVPNELVLMIANSICENVQFEDVQICCFLSNLARVSHRFHDLVNPILYSFDAKSVQSLALPWAIKRGSMKVLGKCVEGGVDLLSHIRSQKPFYKNQKDDKRPIQIYVDDEGRPTTNDVPTVEYFRKQFSGRSMTEQDPEKELGTWKETVGHSHEQTEFDIDVDSWQGDSDLDDDDTHSTTSRESFLGSWEATPLHLACLWGHKHVVQYLLEKDIDLNAPSRGVCSCMEVLSDQADLLREAPPAWTPLHTSICSSLASDMEIAQMLLEAGADVETEALLQETALHTAALQGRTDFVEFLIEGGYQTNLNIKDGRDCTPLHYAYTRSNFCRTIPLLLKHGADINVRLLGRSALANACESSKFGDALTLLDLGADIPTAVEEGVAEHGLLHSCFPRALISPRGQYPNGVSKEHTLLLDRILEQGKLDPNQRDIHGTTPLMRAAKVHCVSGVERLLKAGAKADLVNSDQANAIMYACSAPAFYISSSTTYSKAEPMEAAEKWEMEAIEITQTLMKAGANLDHKDGREKTAFHNLCERGGFLTNLLVRFFMNNGADATSRDKSGNSIFKSALIKGSLEICDILLRHPGGVKSVPQKDIESILTSLLSSYERPRWEKQFEYVLDLLMTPATNVDEIFEKVVEAKKWGAVSTMLKRGLVPPAHKAKVNPLCDLPPYRSTTESRKDHELVLSGLVKLGYNINARNSDGETPLYTAVSSDEPGLVETLLNLGAKVHVGEPPCRPLDAALRRGRNEMVELLLKHTSLKARDGAPQTYLHAALRKQNWFRSQPPSKEPIYVQLLDAGADPNYGDPDQGGDTPLMVFLKWVKEHSGPTIKESRRLADRFNSVLGVFNSRGVDVNKKNTDEGKSVADYLKDLFDQMSNESSPARWVAWYVRDKVEVMERPGGRMEMKIWGEHDSRALNCGNGNGNGTGPRGGMGAAGGGGTGPGMGVGASFVTADGYIFDEEDDEDDFGPDIGGCPCGHYPFG
ncbi:Ankyrin-3 [Zalerion maritima]|uniref:Ankyrin-3 n=1 Tax=Zalerion maritima TaxID=339359 RepID=A0AAD5WWU1_9PEZI|nr:Ankyrin-3 [Zalerion maritima]